MEGRACRIRIIGWGFLTLLLAVVALVLGLKVLLPFRYAAAVEYWASERRLDPYLVAGVIRAESRFRPGVVSSAGAVGLMQITPATGEWIAERLGVTDFVVGDLSDAETSLRFGTWYLRNLLDRFDAVLDDALMAYNAGPNRLERWRSAEGEPFLETVTYLERVLRYRDGYRRWYGSPILGWLLRLLPL